MKKILYIFSVTLILNANENILNESLQKSTTLQKQSVTYSSQREKKSWINPINLSIGKNKNRNTSILGEEDYSSINVNISQDIFRSGGIFYAIKYANISKALGLSQIDEKNNKQIIQAYTLLMQLLKNDQQQLQQRLYVKNSILDIKRKKEQYKAGILDISFLNDAILAKISQQETLIKLQDTKENLLYEFRKLSDKEYKNIELPTIFIPSKQRYINENISLLVQTNSINAKKYEAKLTYAKYLPKLSLNASYVNYDTKNPQSDIDDDYYNYGISLSMPIYLNSYDDAQNARVNYLIAQNEYNIMKSNEAKKYDKILNDLKRLDKRILLSQENILIYEDLYKQNEEQFNAGLKVGEDLQIMKNSKDIREIEIKILQYDKKIKKLELYNSFILAVD